MEIFELNLDKIDSKGFFLIAFLGDLNANTQNRKSDITEKV